MAQLVVRDLADDVKERLKRRAKYHGRSLEAEVRDILEHVPDRPAKSPASATAPGADWVKDFTEKIRAIGLSQEDWDDFDRSLRESRRNWGGKPVEFDP